MTVMTMAAKRNLSVAVFKLEMRHASRHIAQTDGHSSVEKKKEEPPEIANDGRWRESKIQQ